ncbi:unnamed protein product [Blepharisma stoltei]|uniref:Uncharacterized protein n=1 Tax=Blepharisma stoltei TaxID=1481888 RepID=A0AAU9JEF7_9CILI|nr:unnamed protein product [Blepharisma stoltei]
METKSKSSLKKLFRKGTKRNTCAYCDEAPKHKCISCENNVCSFHSCVRKINNKKILICDKCHYSDVQEQLRAEREAELSKTREVLRKMLENNNKLIEDANNEEIKASEIQNKIANFDALTDKVANEKRESIKEILLEQQQNWKCYTSLKEALDRKKSVYDTSLQKWQSIQEQILNHKIEIERIKSETEERSIHIGVLKEREVTSVKPERLLMILCRSCQDKWFGNSEAARKSFLGDMEQQQRNNKVCCEIW